MHIYVKPASASSAHRHWKQFFIPHSRPDCHLHSYFLHAVRDWNSLPATSGLLVPPNV